MLAEAQRCIGAGKFRAAAELLKPLVARDPKNGSLHRALGMCLVRMWLFPEARRHLIEADKRSPRDPAILRELALTYLYESKTERAHELLDKALRISPKHDPSLISKARASLLDSDDQAAFDTASLLSEAARASGEGAVVYAEACEKTGRIDEAAEVLERLMPDGACAPQERAMARFKLARLYEKLERFDEAFSLASLANEETRRVFDPASFLRTIDSFLQGWTREAVGAIPPITCTGTRPVFIVGMPRSGTTLIEQVLAAHPTVSPGGETDVLPDLIRRMPDALDAPPFQLVSSVESLTKAKLGSYRRSYQQRLREKAAGNPVITDKDLHNFLHLGFIAAAFPDARVIHCQRDPMDSCLSSYFTQFVGAMTYSHDFDHLAAVHSASEKLMTHWMGVLDLPIMQLRYEEIVTDPEPHIRKVIDHAGLEWHDDCLTFYEHDRIAMTASADQVRRPIYTSSVSRAAKFAAHLDPLREAIDKYSG
jgi:tetratricopeptide (TPR) repeat protein